MAPLPLPLNGNIEVVGIIPEKASIFKSNLSPLLLYFICSDGSEYPIMFKDGDDMRQDQLVIQLFTLMDRLLRQENLDVKLTPYPVLATGPQQGMMQYIPSKTIANIVSENGTILNYMRAHYPDEGSVGTYGVDPGVIDTFVRSCGKPSALVRASNVLHLVLDLSGLLCRHVSTWCRGPSSGQPSRCAGWCVPVLLSHTCLIYVSTCPIRPFLPC